MIPAILGIPVVEGVVGGIVGSVANVFSPSDSSAPASISSPVAAKGFTPYLNSAAASAANATATQPVANTAPTGSMRADEWGQMAPTDVQTWANSLVGKHVNATDASGRVISGEVNGMQMLGNTLALNIGGHLVSLSQLKQISWSPSVA